MRDISVRHVARAVLGAVLLLSCVLAPPVPASAAGYSRRIAIAPFASLTKEDIGGTVSVLPRLLASRLMALAGADVVLLPAGGKAPEAEAKEAKVPLLLQGTVSKLGKGYSVDTTVTDLETGKTAGAFFASAATEDDIIAQLGVLSGEISEKLFGVQGAIRATAPPAPVAASPAPAAFPIPSGIPAIGGVPVAVSPVSPPAPVSDEGWTPSSIKKAGQSDKIADEIYGVVAGDIDADGNGEVVTWGRNTIYVYRVKGDEILPYTRISRSAQNHFLNVEAIDIDGDGKKDIVVTNLQGDRLTSFVLLRKGDGFVETPGTTRHHLVVLREWNGKTILAGQRQGVSEPFQGKIHAMKWDGKALSEGEPLPLNTSILPVSGGGVYSLSPWPSAKDGRWLYVDVEEKLRVLDAGGKSVYKSKENFGAPADGFEYGEINRQDSRYPTLSLRRAPRAAAGSRGEPLVVVTENRKGYLQRLAGGNESSRVLVLQWEGSGFTERAASPKSDFFYSGVDLLPPGGLRRGGRIIASMIEQSGSAFKDKVSRLMLMRVE
ncbi:MAG: VCBS repeat-containing protein [Deltaproteobacteria bacterium]|nr:MAG: VCBS repeat-containing protein [Deltaproteobacteria bacterium]